MNDVVEVLKNYVNAVTAEKSPQIIVANIRSFAKFLNSPSLQPIITSMKEKKYNDLKEFQTAFTAFQADKKKAFDEIEDFVKSTPF
jgi:hypothetical protein